MADSDWEKVTDPNEMKQYKAAKNSEWEPVNDPKIIQQFQTGAPIGKSLFPGLYSAQEKSLLEGNKESLQGIVQGAQELGQGLKQGYLSAKEKLGYVPEGTESNYTQQVQNERNAYNQSPAASDFQANALRRGTADLPKFAALGPLGLETGLLSKMLYGAGAMGAAKGAEFVPEGESRLKNTSQGILEGAGLPLVEPALIGAGRLARGAANIPINSFKNLSPLEQKAAEAESSAAEAIKNKESAKYESTKETGIATPQYLEYAKNKAQTKLDRLNNLSQQPEVSPAQLQEAKEAADQAHSEYLTAKAASTGELRVSQPHAIQDKINTAKNSLTGLYKHLEENPPTSPEEIQQAKDALNKAHAEYESAKTGAEVEPAVGSSNPNTIQRKINANQAAQEELNQSLAEHPQTHPGDVEQAKKDLDNANAIHKESEDVAKEAENNIAHHLNSGEHHEVSASREMKHDISSINDYWSGQYKDLMKDLKKTKFQLMNPDREDRIEGIIEKFENFEDPNGELAHILKQSPKFSDKSASNFMTKFKDFRDARYNLLQRAKLEKHNETRQQMFKIFDDTKEMDNVLNETLAEGLGEYRPKYQYINNGYSTQVFPLRENNVASRIMEGKKLSSNIAGEFSGDETGQELLREIAKRNQEINRSIVGQHFEKKPDSVYNPNEMLREYTNEMPELNKLIDQRQKAYQSAETQRNNVARAEENHKQAEMQRKQHEESTSALEKKQKDLADKQKNANLMEKFKEKIETTSKQKQSAEAAHQEVTAKSAESEKVKSKIKDFESGLPAMQKHLDSVTEAKNKYDAAKQAHGDIAARVAKSEAAKQKISANKTDLENVIAYADKHIPILQEVSEKADISLENKVKTKEALKRAKSLRKNARTKLYTMAAITGAIPGIYKIKTLLSGSGEQ